MIRNNLNPDTEITNLQDEIEMFGANSPDIPVIPDVDETE